MLLWLDKTLSKWGGKRVLDALSIAFALAALVFGWLSFGEPAPQQVVLPPPATPKVAGTEVLQVKVLTASAPETGDAGQAKEAKTDAALPLAGAQLRLLHRQPNNTYLEVARAVSDDVGQVKFDALPNGPAWLIAEAEGRARRSVAVNLAVQRELSVELPPAHELSVTVLDDQHEPIKDATVLVRDSDSLPFGALSGADGVASFSRLASGPYQVDVFARGYESASRPDVGADLEIVLRRLGEIAVQVIGPDGAAVPKAEVLVVGSSLWPTRRVEANEKGKARLGGLFPGLYDLKAQQGALVSDVMSAVRLSRGENKQVTLRLRPGRYVKVVVSDAESEPKFPVPEANVVLTELGLSSFPIARKTDSKGHVTLGPISHAPAYVAARAEGFIGRSAVPVPDDLTEPMEIALLKGATIRGLVTDTGGRPIDGARVEVIGIDVDGMPIAETPLLAAYRDAHFDWSMKPLPLVAAGELGVTLGPVPFVQSILQGGAEPGWTQLPDDYQPWISGYDGHFKAHPVPPGKVRALVRHPAYVEGVSEVVTLAPGGSAEVTVVLSEGAQLWGRVVDPNDRPVAGARVKVTALKGSYERSAISRIDGIFEFTAVPREVSVSLARPDELSRFVTRKVLSLREGERRELELTLPDERQAIQWRVLDEDDRPVELAQVTLLSIDPDVPLRATRFTDEHGLLELEDVAGLAIRVSVRAPGFVHHDEQLRSAPEQRDLTLKRGVWVRGKVTAVRGRRDVAGARVVLAVEGYQDSTFTTELGEFDFKQVPVGKAQIEVSHEDYARRSLSLKIARTERAARAFELEPIDLPEAASVAGTVVDAEGRPVRGARVGLRLLPAFLPRGRLPEGTVQTDADGAYKLHGIEPGAHTLHAYAAGKGRGSSQVELDGGDHVDDVQIQLDDSTEGGELDVSGGGLAVTLGEKDRGKRVSVVLVQVAEGSEAERAGLRRGDVLKSIDGVVPQDMADARARFNGQPGVDLVVQVRRDGETKSFRVRREQLSH